jgi:hypothetical protein
MTDKPAIRMTRPGRFKRWPKLEAVMQRHGVEPEQPLAVITGGRVETFAPQSTATYNAFQVDEPPCYVDLFIELQDDDAKALPLIRELAALGFEVELATVDAE